MSDEEASRAIDGNEAIDELADDDLKKPIPPKSLEPFGDEETAEVKYRTMKWWWVAIQLIYRGLNN